MTNNLIGVDIGGSHITVSKVSGDTLELIQGTFCRERVDSQGGVASVIKSWSNVIRLSMGKQDLSETKIGIAIPGPFDYEKGVSFIQNQGKYDALYGLNIKSLLSAELKIPEENIRFNNDAACFLQGEICKGGVTSATTVGITLGTGLGSAYMVNGASFDAGLWNMPFKDGIIEDYISSRWFVSECKVRSGVIIKDVKELVEKYPSEVFTKTLFDDFSKHLSDFLLQFIQLKNAYAIVIGGNIAKAEAFFIDKLEKNIFDVMGYKIPIHTSLLGENAALIGAASQFFNKPTQEQSINS